MAQNPYNSHSDKARTKIPTFSDVISAVNSAYKTVDDLGRAAIQKSNAFFNTVFGLNIEEFCDFTSRNRLYMERLMKINDMESDLTLDTVGSDAYESGDSHNISANVLHPSYAVRRDYILNYYSTIVSDTSMGLNSTTAPRDLDANINDENEGYGRDTRLYYDEDDSLQFDAGSGVYGRGGIINPNQRRQSILYKTKRVFAEKKINTIISAFHTKPMNHGNDEPTSRYGLSHGRNLLTKKAESGQSYKTNGYDNPYCRVWTHHYQYDRLDKLIRPFVITDDNGNSRRLTVKDFHTWKNFKMGDGSKEWGWKNGVKEWDNVVLNDNGFVNFTPSFRAGGSTNIHTKQCMFSIENLAWKGFDPYSFEKALSWEQRGPNGGRIMWFAPYGISFSESTNTDWNEHTFIGRGESVYTYANTKRTGTLSFMLVVDHPSIVDYVTWRDSDDVSDTDVLRFMAGCDGGSSAANGLEAVDRSIREYNLLNDGKGKLDNLNVSGGGLSDSAIPTPLTDEYVEKTTKSLDEVDAVEAPKPEPATEEYEEPHTAGFFVFFPNNYSGTYDIDNPDIDPMAYLLAGVGAQTEYDSSNPTNSITKTLLFEDMSSGATGYGYEMVVGTDKGITSGVLDPDVNYIHGTSQTWSQAKSRNSRKWIPAAAGYKHKWYYRIDGEYTANGKVDDADKYRNCYDQTLVKKNSYYDKESFGFNSDAEVVKSKLASLLPMDDELYSFAEIAYIFASDGSKGVIRSNTSKTDEEYQKRIEDIQKILKPEEGSKSQISSITVVGYSNSHGQNSNAVNNSRNAKLAEQRATSVAEWLKECFKDQPDVANVISTGAPEVGKDVGNNGVVDASHPQAKGYRSAYVKIEYKTTETKTQAESDATEKGSEVNYLGFERQVDATGKEVWYKDQKGNLWKHDSKRGKMVRVQTDSVLTDRSGYGSFRNYKLEKGTDSANGKDEVNKLRYDQEYHFFKVLQKEDPIVFSSLMKKLKYFDPAFHSTTPEGFNARLTFLSQCMRQGNTLTISDNTGVKGQLTNNLAFGRAPYCVLRLGDFYNQLIVIDNITITYDPLQWDLNVEGIGVQPLLANVQISFKFVGGGDLSGPIRRLQNAMTFNYYANTQLYDNRSDRLSRNFDYKTNTDSELDNSEIKDYYHDVQMKGK